jgi:hypothetical protein
MRLHTMSEEESRPFSECHGRARLWAYSPAARSRTRINPPTEVEFPGGARRSTAGTSCSPSLPQVHSRR